MARSQQVNISELSLALIRLNRLIGEGVEFPDAVWKTTRLYPEVSSYDLERAYDEEQMNWGRDSE